MSFDRGLPRPETTYTTSGDPFEDMLVGLSTAASEITNPGTDWILAGAGTL